MKLAAKIASPALGNCLRTAHMPRFVARDAPTGATRRFADKIRVSRLYYFHVIAENGMYCFER